MKKKQLNREQGKKSYADIDMELKQREFNLWTPIETLSFDSLESFILHLNVWFFLYRFFFKFDWIKNQINHRIGNLIESTIFIQSFEMANVIISSALFCKFFFGFAHSFSV